KMIAARAEPLLRQATSEVANDVDALEALGTMLSLQGRASEAIPILDRALTLAPERASLLESAALADPTPARWQRYLAVAPLRPRTHLPRDEPHAPRHDWPQVIIACRESLRLDPTFVPARTQLAKALHETGDALAAEREQAILDRLNAATRNNQPPN